MLITDCENCEYYATVAAYPIEEVICELTGDLIEDTICLKDLDINEDLLETYYD